MSPTVSLIIYVFMFFLVYYQVFILLTFFEHKHKFSRKPKEHPLTDSELPAVTILVPVFNEEKTVEKTIRSLLNLNYPAEKLFISIVDDGSKDNTWNLIQQYAETPNVQIHRKENGGKYTALNYGIAQCETNFIGCLDADSEVHPDALRYIIPNFANREVMAVTPSMKIKKPDSIIRLMQNAEYNMGIFLRKIMELIDAQYVTPGPFSIFRKQVFAQIGNYKHAHNTEDLEMALRMQNSHMKIVCEDKAVVYTVGPKSFPKLYKQRVRWTGGFIQNAMDYKHMIMNPKYGNLGMLVLPLTFFIMVGTLFALGYSAYSLTFKLLDLIRNFNIIGWGDPYMLANTSPSVSNLIDWLYYHLHATFLLSVLTYGLIIFSIWAGKRIANVKDTSKMDIFYFIVLYSLLSPIWLIKSVYNTIRRRDAVWR